MAVSTSTTASPPSRTRGRDRPNGRCTAGDPGGSGWVLGAGWVGAVAVALAADAAAWAAGADCPLPGGAGSAASEVRSLPGASAAGPGWPPDGPGWPPDRPGGGLA